MAELTPTGSYLPDNVVASAALKEDTEHQGDFMDHVILAGQGVSVCAEGVAHGAYHPLKPLLLRIWQGHLLFHGVSARLSIFNLRALSKS